MIVTYLRILSWNSLGEGEENNEKLPPDSKLPNRDSNRVFSDRTLQCYCYTSLFGDLEWM